MRSSVTFFLLVATVTAAAGQGFRFDEKPEEQKIDVLYDGKPLTSYCYFDSVEKPVLFPIRTLTGVTITRGYPLTPRAGERTDHPHHVGLWLNYESVNGLDFWNNSFAIPSERKDHYGSIEHEELISKSASKDQARLKTRSRWVSHEGRQLLEEITDFHFTVDNDVLIIDRVSTLLAIDDTVVFRDVKDGLLGLRVARELELPSTQEDRFIDASGNATTVPKLNNEGVTGMYLNREGLKGDDVWGKRSRWTVLSGNKDGQMITIGMIDHPTNPGYPAYWHARGYGLFAVNPLGQKVFSNGTEEMNLTLRKGEKCVFAYRIVIHSGSHLKPGEMEELSDAFGRIKY